MRPWCLVSINVIDAFILEALAATGVGLGLVARQRLSKSNRAAALPPMTRSIAQLPYRHRHEARAIVSVAREHLGRHPDGSVEAFTARESLRSYLPETIAAYLAVPPTRRRSRRADGRSADDQLSHQLRTLRCGLERLRDADADIGAARMAQNGAFLHERFGPPAPQRVPSRPLSTLSELIDVLSAYLRRV